MRPMIMHNIIKSFCAMIRSLDTRRPHTTVAGDGMQSGPEGNLEDQETKRHKHLNIPGAAANQPF
jgi:hypothetical protein